MRWVIPALLVLLIGVVIVALARQDPGYVMIQFRGWTVETSLLFTVIALSAGFLVLYVVIRLFAGARRLAPWFLEWRHQRRQRAALRAIGLGFLELEEGQWRRAERRLISHLDADGGAVLAWLGAARAAHELGADQRRDDYLKQAGEHMPKAEVALTLARAQMLIDAGHYRQARATLDRLRLLAPRNPVVLARVIRLSVEQQDWEAVIAAIPAARRRGAFDAGRLEHIERRAWLGLLGAAAADADALERLWRRVPAAIRADAEVARRYADRLATLSPAR